MSSLRQAEEEREQWETQEWSDDGCAYEPMRGMCDPSWDLWEEWMGWEGAGIRDYSSHINPYIWAITSSYSFECFLYEDNVHGSPLKFSAVAGVSVHNLDSSYLFLILGWEGYILFQPSLFRCSHAVMLHACWKMQWWFVIAFHQLSFLVSCSWSGRCHINSVLLIQ